MKIRACLLPLLLIPLVAEHTVADEPSSHSDVGLHPQLADPESKLIPTLNAAAAKPWPSNTLPQAAAGLKVEAYASGLNHPRWLYVLPNGDVLVAETNAPAKGKADSGIRAAVQKSMMKKAGAAVPSPDRIILLRGINEEGRAKTLSVFLQGLHSPFGMALVKNDFYVANADAVVKFPYVENTTEITEPGSKVIDLPGGPINHHWTKNIIASSDGSKLYVTVGSNSNVGENGLDNEEGRAAIHEIDLNTQRSRIFASGLRNPNGLAWQPQSGALWTTVNERDELGNDLVPDYMTSVRDGGFYGWPFSYFGDHVDERVNPPNPALVATAIKPDYALGSHTASLGLTFYTGDTLPQKYKGGAFIGQHGSWNRKPHSGYKVIFVAFNNGQPTGLPEDVLTGFLSDKQEAYGRPVGVAIDATGALLVADDVGNVVWRVTAQ